MIIRNFKQDDEPAVIDLWDKCQLINTNNNPKLDISRKLEIAPELFLVAERDRKIIASVMGGYEGHRGWIHYLAVHPHHRRLGIGKKLMFDIEQRLKQQGCPKINLQIRANNNEVISFYQKIGFLNEQVISMGKRITDDPPYKN